MKRSIKAATLTFFVTSLLAGCSSAGPAPIAQVITVNPESKVTTKDKSFELSTNASTATWSLEENLCQANLSATEGKTVTVSAGSVGTVTVVASASGYTTEKVALTFDPMVQELTVDPASAKVYLDESIGLSTNLASANWTLQDNDIGATLSAESGKSVTVSAVSAGTVKAVATAEGAKTAEVVLTFEALLPQTLSADPTSKEVFTGKTITVSTSAASAGWSLENNTCDAKLTTSAQGKSVTVQGDSIGTVDVVAKSENHSDARITLSFVQPHWTDDEKAAMSAALHGEILPYPFGAGDLRFIDDNGIFVIGETISVESLAAYAANFTAAEGWVLVESSEDGVYYSFEKEVLVEEERRFVNVLFGSLDAEWEDFEENGFLYLQASDPYIYSVEEAIESVEAAKAKIKIQSEVEVPVPSGHHYEVSSNEEAGVGRLYSYEVEKGEFASVADLYSDLLLKTEDYNLYAYDPVFEGFVAEEKSGAFSLVYAALDETTLVVLIRPGVTYVHEWPTEDLAALVKSLDSEVVIPVFEAEKYYVSSYEAQIGPVMNINCYGFSSEDPYGGYINLLEGWTLFGEFNFGTEKEPELFYLANSPDGKVGIQVTVKDGVLSIYVAPRNFDAEFPTAYFESIKAMLGVESEYQIPVLPAGGYEFDAYYDEEELVVMTYCFAIDNPEAEADGGYGKILEAEGWIVSSIVYVTQEGEFTLYVADSPDQVYGIQWVYNAEQDYAAIYMSFEPYFYYEWPAESIQEFTASKLWSDQCIPGIEADYYDFDEEYGRVTCYGVAVSEEAPDAGYGALLEKAGFTLMGEREEEGMSYWTANSEEGLFGAYGVAYWVEDDVLYIQYTNAWYEISEEFPAEAIASFYSELGGEGIKVPEYSIAAEGSFFEIDDSYVSYGLLVVFANGSTSDERIAYEEALVAGGWSLVVPAEPEESRADEEEEVYSAQYQFGETGAYIEVIDYSAEGYITLAFEYEVPLLEDFPASEVAAFFEENGVIIPEENIGVYAVASEDAGFEIDDSYEGYFDVYVYESSAKEMDAYKDQLVSLGWTVVGEYEGDYELQYGETAAYVDLINYGDYIDVSFFVESDVPPSEDMTPEEIADEMGSMFGISAEEEEDYPGTWSFYACFDSSLEGNTVEEICGYIDDCFSNLFDEFELEGGEWGTDKYGDPMCYYVSEAGVVCEIYVYEDTVYVDEDGYIVDEGTEGATAVDVVAIEFYSYYDA